MAEPAFISRDTGRARLRKTIAQRRAAGDIAPAKHLAEELGISRPFLSRILGGQTPMPEKVARVVGLRPVKGYVDLS